MAGYVSLHPGHHQSSPGVRSDSVKFVAVSPAVKPRLRPLLHGFLVAQLPHRRLRECLSRISFVQHSELFPVTGSQRSNSNGFYFFGHGGNRKNRRYCHGVTMKYKLGLAGRYSSDSRHGRYPVNLV